MQEIDQIPPNDPEIECCALACMLSCDLGAREISEGLTPDDFYSPQHGKLFAILSDMVRAGAPDLDVPTVRLAMESAGLNRHLLTEVFGSQASILSIERYIERLKELRWRRSVLYASQRALTSIGGPELAERAAELRQALETVPTREYGRPIGEYLADPKTLEPTPRAPTAIADLDRALQGGPVIGGLYLLAGPPGGGKSTVTRAIGAAASMAGLPTLLVTLEDPAPMAVKKIWAARAGVLLSRIESKRMPPADADALKAAAAGLSKAPLTIADGPSDLAGLEGYLLAAARRGVKLACIDQLSWIAAPGETVMERTAAISRRLRIVAQRAGLAVWLCVQLNRAGCQREGGPTMHDLRDCGNLEQDGDGVLLVKSVEAGETPEGPCALTLEIAKHRHGPQGPDQLVRLSWFKPEARIESYIPDFPQDEPRTETREAVGAAR